MPRILEPRHRPSSLLVAPAALLLTAFLVPGLLILAGQGEPAFNGVDTQWQALIFTLHSPFWDQVNAFLNWLGYVGVLILEVLLVAVLLLWRRPKMALFSALAALIALGVTQLAKAVVGRDRPEGAKVLTDTGSYPSGHVSATAVFLMTLVLLTGKLWFKLLAIAGILVMMASRTYLSAHWLSDVLGGACVGVGVTLLLWVPFMKICIQENLSAVTSPVWQARASRRQPAEGQPE
ncbi:phosphatase PAP2 family protein [Paenarthrobacter ureafaciens]|uniref:phosphatase PAP2 family protein n=1 Tax=Paenarthrobacter ureafaciens TaxID=37931 RepID=UPI001FB1F286|nr:phosphatase PAP2 family protein [Paenarthrobacter ureafaciens]UOD81306.1 phosphatase PAP2 family protein [Paenarthrobacter ureafaciens]WNZ03956.1 phosphatase PAP2 family protein [Paenarthrobacter ureafaciens]